MIIKLITISFLISFIGFCSSCRKTIECKVNPIKAELQQKQLPDGTIGLSYSTMIYYSARSGDSKHYKLTDFKIKGDMPKGLSISPFYVNTTSFIINGKPSEKGTFKFSINIEMDKNTDFTDASMIEDMCNDTDTKEYSITIK